MKPNSCEARFRLAESLALTLHNPVRRHELDRQGEWSIRTDDWDSPGSAMTLRSGGHHIQLWNPRLRISVITPSTLTHGHYEISLACGCRHRIRCVEGVALFLKVCHETEFPPLASWGCYAVPPVTPPEKGPCPH